MVTPPAGHRRVAMLVEYDGGAYFGLQRQPHEPATIQQKIEEAATVIGSQESAFVGSGRTDSGVHALGQVVAVSLPEKLDARRIPLAMNANLPEDIRVREAVPCGNDFSPRFDAIRRHYVYRLVAHTWATPLERHMVARLPHRLDPEATIAAAAVFVGKWELKEWRASSCQATRTLLNIDAASASPPDGERNHWVFRFAARSFLHHQVRFMVGGIAAVGIGKLTIDQLTSALAAGRRPLEVAMLPACGLCLARVEFSPDKDPFAAGAATPTTGD